MPVYKTPGVYVEEIATLPPSVAEVATAVPAFVGYTELGPADAAEPKVLRIASLLDYRTAFGGPPLAKFQVATPVAPSTVPAVTAVPPASPFSLYHAISHYFKNGGGPVFVASVGNYKSLPSKARFLAGLQAVEKEDEPTLLVLTDAAALLSAGAYYEVCGEALAQCARLGDRFTIIDVAGGDVVTMRNDSNLSARLNYGAAYHPYLQTTLTHAYRDEDVDIVRSGAAQANVTGSVSFGAPNGIVVSFTGAAASTAGVVLEKGDKNGAPAFAISGDTLTISNTHSKTGNDLVTAWTTFKGAGNVAGFDISRGGDGTGVAATTNVARTVIPMPKAPGETMASIRASETALYAAARTALDAQRVVLPPSAAVAGIYCRVDRDQGVWKAPANVGVLAVLGPVAKITDADQDNLNVDPTAGKSVNAIRAFTGKGTLVWGARTLAGNDNEWRYVSVRRLFITIEESARKATAFAVFEPNDANTWLKVKAMIESYLYGLWERGALAGSKPESAFFVRVGLGTTMTPQDVLEGRMVVEIGVAAVRPAEFIILRFSHKLQTE